MKLIDGKTVAKEMRQKIKEEVAGMEKKPGLAVVLVGKDPASQVYVNLKDKRCKEIGMESYKHELPESASEKEVLALIDKLNKDDAVNGILVQMPVPKQISAQKVMEAVLPEKDVDGFHPMSIGRMVAGKPSLQACTPRGVMKLLAHYGIDVAGKDVTVIGRSLIVGTPVALMLMAKNATVTVCHSKTKDLKANTQHADIIVTAVGKKRLVTADMVKEGAVVVDVGMIRDEGKLCGDVDFDNVKEKCSYITPVPGGVGPMTIACLLENTMLAYRMQNKT